MASPTKRARRYRQVGAGTVLPCADEPVQEDPFANPSVEGKISVYGIATSRVTKVLWAAAECGIRDVGRVQLKPVELAAQPWFMDLNPKLTVPVLRDGPLILNESNTIVSYLCNKYGRGAGMYPEEPASLAIAWQWLEYAETTMAESQAPIFFAVARNIAYPFGSTLKSSEEIRALVPALEKAFHGLEVHLASDGRSYILGESFTMADITAGVQATRFFTNKGYGFPELEPRHFPFTESWLQRLADRQAYKEQVLTSPFAK